MCPLCLRTCSSMLLSGKVITPVPQSPAPFPSQSPTAPFSSPMSPSSPASLAPSLSCFLFLNFFPISLRVTLSHSVLLHLFYSLVFLLLSIYLQCVLRKRISREGDRLVVRGRSKGKGKGKVREGTRTKPCPSPRLCHDLSPAHVPGLKIYFSFRQHAEGEDERSGAIEVMAYILTHFNCYQ